MAGAHVVLACRNVKAALAASKRIREERPRAELVTIHCDLTSLRSVQRFAQEYLNSDWSVNLGLGDII